MNELIRRRAATGESVPEGWAVIDLGELNWQKWEHSTNPLFRVLIIDAVPSDNYSQNQICDRFTRFPHVSAGWTWATYVNSAIGQKYYAVSSDHWLCFRADDMSMTTDDFKASVKGVKFYYKLIV